MSTCPSTTTSVVVSDEALSPDDIALTPEGAAAFLGLSPKTLANWRGQGIGPAYIAYGRRTAYLRSDLEAFRASRRVANA